MSQDIYRLWPWRSNAKTCNRTSVTCDPSLLPKMGVEMGDYTAQKSFFQPAIVWQYHGITALISVSVCVTWTIDIFLYLCHDTACTSVHLPSTTNVVDITMYIRSALLLVFFCLAMKWAPSESVPFVIPWYGRWILPTVGQVWPKPQQQTSSETFFVLRPTMFQFQVGYIVVRLLGIFIYYWA